MKNFITNSINAVKNAKLATKETKIFFIVSFLFIAPVILGAIYTYARLDFVRSYETNPKTVSNDINKK